MKKIHKKTRKSLFLTLMFMFISLFTAVGCSLFTPKLNGFDIKEEVQVYHNSFASAQSPLFVTDDKGDIYDVMITVLDSNGKKVQTDEGDVFIATDKNGYTIIYTITTFDFTIEKRTKVIVLERESETGNGTIEETNGGAQ